MASNVPLRFGKVTHYGSQAAIKMSRGPSMTSKILLFEKKQKKVDLSVTMANWSKIPD